MRILHTPISEVTAEKQLLKQGQYNVALKEDGSIDLEKCYYTLWIQNFPSEEYVSKKVMWPSLPSNIKSTLRTLHGQVLIAAQSMGLIGSGTDEADF